MNQQCKKEVNKDTEAAVLQQEVKELKTEEIGKESWKLKNNKGAGKTESQPR